MHPQTSFLILTSTGEAVEPLPEQGVSEVPIIRKPSKESTWLGPKESAVRQHRQEMKTKMKTNKVEEMRLTRPKQVRLLKPVCLLLLTSHTPDPLCPRVQTLSGVVFFSIRH